MLKRGVFEAEVICNQPIRGAYWQLDFKLDTEGCNLFKYAVPGQFLELDLSGVAVPHPSKIPDSLKDSAHRPIMLRRPFSFSNITIKQSANKLDVTVQILYCVLGPGSVRMANLKKGDIVSVLGPLGNGFSIPSGLSLAVLVMGGIGSPPILHLADYLRKNHPDCRIACFVGAKSSDDFPFTLGTDNKLEEFERIQVSAHLATDDGSVGHKGYVTDCAQLWLQKNTPDPASTVIYSCGPEPMLAATAQLAEKFQLACQVSMERMMACGIGLCQSCAVEVGDPNRYHLCCKDGPVFNAKKVVWKTD